MIFAAPKLTTDDQAVLRLIQEQKELLRYAVAQRPNRWTGFLRRTTFARALQGSNTIEGINATLSEAAAIIDDEKPDGVEEETYRALVGYRIALTYILQTHDDPYFELNSQVIKSLHFMMLAYDLTKMPGQWRRGGISVIREPSGEVVYEGPDGPLVPGLIDEFVSSLSETKGEDPIVRGAMAHLNFTMIHPFKDGNGRMARALQTMIIARDGLLSPVFCSIEEWLGRNTDTYYRILEEVGRGRWSPQNDGAPWLRFCLRAHYQQATTLTSRQRATESAWAEIVKIVKAERLQDRTSTSLLDATFGYQVRSGSYQKENEVSDVVASRDLKRLCDAGLLIPVGEKRGRYYVAGKPLKDLYLRIKDDRRPADPYELVRRPNPKHEPELPGL